MTTRRSFLKGLFSGVVLATVGVGTNAVAKVYHSHDHYVAPGKFNIWYIHDEEWHLLSDSYEAPFEFDSENDAEKYIDTVGLERFVNAYGPEGRRVKSYSESDYGMRSREGLVKVRSGPREVHNFTHLNMTMTDAQTFLDKAEAEIGTKLSRGVRGSLLLYLTASNGGIQAGVWSNSLAVVSFKREIVWLQNSSMAHAVRALFCTNSYHSHKAKLHTFYRPTAKPYGYSADEVTALMS
jgi:hypothetical protein